MLLNGGAALCISRRQWSADLFGETVPVGTVLIYNRHVQADDSSKLSEALEAGTAADKKITVRPANGDPFLIYAPQRLPPGTAIHPYRWEMRDIPEHAGFSALPDPLAMPTEQPNPTTSVE